MKNLLNIQLLVPIVLALIAIYFFGGIWVLLVDLILKSENKPIDLLFKSFGIVFAAFLILIYIKIDNKDIFKLLKPNCQLGKINLRLFIIGYLITAFAIIIALIIGYILNIVEFKSFSWASHPLKIIVQSIIFFGFFNNLFITIGEEFIFRGFVLSYFYNILGKKSTAIILSASVFSISHFNYSYFFEFQTAFLGGLILGYAYIIKGSLLFTIGIHLSWNFTIFLTSLEPFPTDLPSLIMNQNYKYYPFFGLLNYMLEILALSLIYIIIKFPFNSSDKQLIKF